MRSEFTFIMHPLDEKVFVQTVLAEPGVVFVDGRKWLTPNPPIKTDISSAGDHLLIWQSGETPELEGHHHQKDNQQWWYCENEYLTIQFLRSGLQDEQYLFTGRIAIWTTTKEGEVTHLASAASIEKRFKFLKKFLQKTYTNNVLLWQNLSLPRSKTNPCKPDSKAWIGPHALEWLRENPTERWVQTFKGAGAKAYLLDLVQ